ncbi:MAG TPA: aminotransferase class V-fold PLP-dependent enzyme [Mycobacteriales bacterium]|nr:aminotransferase class V-fold PLP-dependent enzyme [Mycobacteriales bacterium]
MSASPRTYLDAATAVPLHPAAAAALQAALADGWADPDRLYSEARRARRLLDAARETAAAALGVRAPELSFTASGTQANQLALLGGLAARRRTGGRLLVSAVEHSSVLHTAARHAAGGGDVVTVGVDRLGRVDPDEYAAHARADGVALASLQSANHEVGTTQPVTVVAAACAAAGVPLHVDAAQSLGRMAPPTGWSLLTASARKWGGPPGVGLLVVRTGTRWRSPLPADEHEAGRVPGAVGLPGVLAAAAALEATCAEQPSESPRQRALIGWLRANVPRRVPDVEVIGDPDERLPHLVTFSCLYVDGEALLHDLDRAGFAVSSGSSCTASTLTPSHVLEAMGVLTHGNVRVSLHRGVVAADLERFVDALAQAVDRIRTLTGAPGR